MKMTRDTMWKVLVTVMLGTLFVLTVLDEVKAQGAPCIPQAEARKVLEKHKERYLASLKSDGTPARLYVNPETGTWTLVGIVKNGSWCLLGHGTDFKYDPGV